MSRMGRIISQYEKVDVNFGHIIIYYSCGHVLKICCRLCSIVCCSKRRVIDRVLE